MYLIYFETINCLGLIVKLSSVPTQFYRSATYQSKIFFLFCFIFSQAHKSVRKNRTSISWLKFLISSF